MKNNAMRKLVAWLLTLLMVINMCPISVFAEPVTDPAEEPVVDYSPANQPGGEEILRATDETWAVTFYNRDAEVHKVVNVVKGTPIGDQLPAVIAREDYTASWAIGEIVQGAQGPEIRVTGGVVGANYVPTDDTTVVPDYEKITYKVTFYEEDKSTVVAQETVDVDTSYCLNDIPSVPEKTGSKGKWVYSGGDFGNTVTITEDTSVWPVYDQNVFTVTFVVEGKEYETDTYYIGDSLTLPAAPVVEGKDFTGWFVGETQYNGGEAVTSDLTLTAKFTDQFKVDFVILNDDQTVQERLSQFFRSAGEAIGTMPQDPFVAGKVFEKWVIQGTTTEVTAETVVNNNMTVVAQFRKVTVYNITAEYFYMGSSGEVIFNTDYHQVETHELPYTITAPDSTQTDPNQVPGAPIYYPRQTSITVTADDFDDDNKCTIRFEYVEYTAVYDFVYLLKDLTGDGYTEIDRTEDVRGVLNSYVTPIVKTFDYAVLELAEGATITQEEGQELPVKYTRKSFQLSYETNGGSYVGGGTYPYGTSVSLSSTTPTKDGYTFEGWYSDEGLTQKVTGSVTINADTTLYANWTGNRVNYTIIYMKEEYHSSGNEWVYENSRTAQATVGTTVYAASAPAITLNGYEKLASINGTATAGGTGADTAVEIKADGSATLKVYYSLIRYTLVFNINRNSGRITMNGQTYTGSNYRIENVVLGQDVSSMWPSDNVNEIYDTATGGNKRYFEYWSGATGSYVTKRYELILDNVSNANANHVQTYTANWSRSDNSRSAEYWLQQPDGTYKREDAYNQFGLNTTNLSAKNIDGYTKHTGTPRGYSGSGYGTDAQGTYCYIYRFYYDRAQYHIDYYYGTTKLTTKDNIYFEADITGSEYDYTPSRPSGVDSDYTWGGWYADSKLAQKYTFSTMPGHHLMLYAKWVAPSFTVSFVDGDEPGTQLADSQTVEKYEKAQKPTPNPTKEGYTFDGWYTTADGDTLYDWNIQITENTTIYAHWAEKTLTYTVRYVNENNEDIATEKTVSNPNLKVGQTVEEKAIAITGYRPMKNSDSLKLTYNDEENVIIFIYKEKGDFTSYTVRYIIDPSEYAGNIPVAAEKNVDDIPADTADVVELAAAVNYDALYTAHPELEGLEFFPDEVEKTLVLTADEDQNVLTFIYSQFRSAKVTVNFVDMNGDKIADADVQNLKVGKTFTLSRTPIAGWELNKAVVGKGTSGEEAKDSYKITDDIAESGELIFTLVYQKKVTVTAVSASKMYDGTELKLPDGLENQVIVEGLLSGDSLTSADFGYTNTDNNTNDGRINAGVATVTPKNAKISGKGANSSYYTIRYISGTLEVTKINVTVRVEPDRWTGAPYTGEEYKAGFTNPNKGIEDYILISHEGYKTAYLNDIWNTLKSKATAGGAGLGYYGIVKTDAGDYDYDINLAPGELPKNDNYSVSLYVRQGRLQILPAELTVITGSAEKVYDGTPLTEETVTLDGLVDADKQKVTATATGSQTEVGESDNTYEMDWGDVNPDNYTIVGVELGTLEVTAATLKVTVNDTEKPYNGADQEGYTFPATITGTGETITTDDYTIEGLGKGDVLTITYTAAKGKNAGDYTGSFAATYTITNAEGKDSKGNYESATFTPGKLKITKLSVTLTSADDSKTYDGTPLTNDTVTVTGDGFVSGEGATYNVTGTITDPGTAENTFTYTLKDGTLADNYEIETVFGTLEITKNTKEIVITAESDSKTYDGSPLTNDGYTYTENVLASGDVLTAVVEGTITNVGTAENKVTSYKVMRGTTDVTANYTFGESVDGTLEVTKRSVILTSGSAEKAYDGTPLTNDEVTVTGDGFATGEGATYDVTGTITDVGSVENEFTYKLKEGTSADNYDIQTVFGTLEITKNTKEIVITAESDSKKYDGTPLTNDGYTYTQNVLASGDVLTAVVEGTITNVGTAANKVTSYKVMRGETDVTANYTFGESVDGELEITQRTVTMTSATDSKTYDGTPLTNDEVTVDGDGFVDGEGATYDVTGTITDPGTAKNTFTYTLNDGTLEGNYDIKQVEGTLTINKITTEIVITADSDNKVYDGSPLTKDTYTYTQNVLASGDVLTAVVEGTITNVGTAANKVTSYKVMRGETDVTANYTFGTSVDGKLEVTKRTVTLTSATDTKVYDGTALTNDKVTVDGDGFADGEGATYDVTGTQTDVGNSPNAFEYTLNSNTLADNYSITKTEGTLTVTAFTDKVTVTITEHSGTEKYDGTEKSVTGYDVSIDNELYTEADFTFSGDATVKGTDANTYPMELKPEDFTNNSKNFTNVEFKIVDGTLEISRRTVTLTSADGEKVYDGTPLTNSNVTVGSDGFADGEGATYNVTGTITDVGEEANSFTYTLNSNTKDSNYDISPTEGTLKITPVTDKVTVTITEHSGTETYDGTEKTVTGYDVDISNKLYTEADFTFSGDATVKGTDADSYDMELKPEDFTNNSKNFTNVEFKIVDGKLTIDPAKLTIKTESATKEYDGKALTADGSIEGFVNGETATFEVTGSQIPVGKSDNTYTLTWDGTAKETNYVLDETIGKLEVTASTTELKVVSADGSWTYDGETHTKHEYTVTYGSESYAITIAEGETSGTATLSTGDTVTVEPTTIAKVTNVADGTVKNTFSYTLENSAYYSKQEKEVGSLNITPRPVTLTSATDSKSYDATPLTNNEVTVGGDGFVEGEGATYNVTGTQTLVGSSENTFTYTLNEGTKQANYTITTVFGTLTVTDEDVPPDKVVEKTAEEAEYKLGDTVTFTITATNIYDVPKTLKLTEKENVTLAQATFENVAPGATITTTATYTITEADILEGSFTNTVTVTIDKDWTTDKTVDTEDPNPHVTIEKETTSTAASGDGKYALGETIEYKITVTNDGNLTVEDIEVEDALTGDTWYIDSLVPGSVSVLETSYTVTEADILAGKVLNVATGKAKDDVPVDPGEKEDPTEDPKPHLTINKVTTSTAAREDGKYALGEIITYMITVTNDGNVTVKDIEIEDELTGDKWTLASLAPGQTSEDYTATYTVTEADILAGEVVNEATGKGKGPDDKDVPVTPGVDPEPTEEPNGHLTVNKVTTSKPGRALGYVEGETISYQITVVNDGNLTITDIKVEDELTGDTWEIDSLLPGTEAVYETSYVVTAADEAAGTVLNVATATGKSPDPDKPDVPVTPGRDPERTLAEYNLTILYVYQNGVVAAAPYTDVLYEGDAYNVPSPGINGFAPAIATVAGTMPDHDVTVTVIYVPAVQLITIEDFETPLGMGLGSINAGETIE